MWYFFTDYVFENWTENNEVVSTEPVYTFTATSNRSLVANLLYTEGLNEAEGGFTIYPIPASASLTIEAEGEVTIIDKMGRVVKSLVVDNKQTIDLHGLSSGVYLVKAGNVLKKIVVK